MGRPRHRVLHLKKRLLIPPALRPPKAAAKRGAPFGSRNAYKHGKFTRERRALYADIRAYIAKGRALMAELSRSCARYDGTLVKPKLSSPADPA